MLVECGAGCFGDVCERVHFGDDVCERPFQEHFANLSKRRNSRFPDVLETCEDRSQSQSCQILTKDWTGPDFQALAQIHIEK
jgi:hypothetical protein